jgi:CelD/BcsL family acetyltransferase involved in cellulose biosynthesis
MTGAASSSHPPAALRIDRKAAFARVEIHETPAEILSAWAELEAVAPCSAYQTRRFLLTWIKTAGTARGIAPIFVTARDERGRVVALLPLGLQSRWGVKCAVFLGGNESNFNLGLFRAPDDFARGDIDALWRMTAKALGKRAPDVFLLLDQPETWDGVKNPLSHLPHQPSPSYAYGTALLRNAEAFLASKQSKERRKKLRKKQARIEAMGALSHITNKDSASAQTILAAFYAQKTARCETQAIDTDFSDPTLQKFYQILSEPSGDGEPAMELHALCCGSRIIAVFGGMRHYDRFSGMIISFDADEEIAKSSPGELLLSRVIAAQCEHGLTTFDLGIGESGYKATYCDCPIALFDVFFPITIKGTIWAAYMSLRRHVKRSIKQNQNLLVPLRRIKRFLWRHRL